MPPSPSRGEVRLVDLGLAAKTRPCLVAAVLSRISIAPSDARSTHDQRAWVSV